MDLSLHLSHFLHLLCSGWLLWTHLLLLFSTDNWLEQWNACVPLPLTLYTLFIFWRTRLCSLCCDSALCALHSLPLSPSPPLSLSPSRSLLLPPSHTYSHFILLSSAYSLYPSSLSLSPQSHNALCLL